MESGAGARDARGYALNRLLKLFLDSCLSPLATPERAEFREAAVPPCTKFRLGYLLNHQIENLSLVVDRSPEPEWSAPNQKRHRRDATAASADDVCGEAAWRIRAQTSTPIA